MRQDRSDKPDTAVSAAERDLRRRANTVGGGLLVMTVLMTLLLSVVLTLLALVGVRLGGGLADNYYGLGNTVFLLVYAMVYAVGFLLPWWLMRRWYPPVSRPTRRHIRPESVPLWLLSGLGACMAGNVLASMLSMVLEDVGLPIPDMPALLEPTKTSLVLNLLVVAVLPALLEELLFRGAVLTLLRPAGDRVALWVSALAFGLMHGNLLQIPFAVVVGLALGKIVLRTGSLKLSIAIHFLNNALSCLLTYTGYSLAEEQQVRLAAAVIYGLLAVGVVAALLLRHVAKDGGSDTTAPPAQSALTRTARLRVLTSAPALMLSFSLFILLLIINTFWA